MSSTYDSSSIEVLTGLEPVRKRPGMYTLTERPNHLAQEKKCRRSSTVFYTGATSPGSGLGLTIARNLVEAHGGRIDVESTPDQGTAIRFDLPSLLHN